MAIRIVTADERLSAAHNKTSLAIFGPPGCGKTSLLTTLLEDQTVAIDLEAGMKSVQSWRGVSLPVRTFPDFRDLVVLIGGPDPAADPNGYYSAGHHGHAMAQYQGSGLLELLAQRSIVFVDSITDLTRQAMAFAKQQPEAFSERTGKPDVRGAYGLLGREVIQSLKHLQHAPGKTVIFVGVLEKVTDDLNLTTWQPQMEGSKVGRELPGIVDQVVSMQLFSKDDRGEWLLDERATERRLVCRSGNSFGLPAKDRSGRLDETEAPDLGALLAKINRSAPPIQPVPPAPPRLNEGAFPMYDLNDAPAQMMPVGELIPDGTFAKVRLSIRPGGVNGAVPMDAGILKASPSSDAKMLDCEFTVVEGAFVRRKFWQNFTVSGGKVDDKGQSKGWNIAKGAFRAMVDSALGLDPKDMSEAAKRKRLIQGLKQLDGITFVARIMVEPTTDARYRDQNRLANVVVPGEPNYAAVMRGEAVAPDPINAQPRKAAAGAPAQNAPAWVTDAAPAPAAQQTDGVWAQQPPVGQPPAPAPQAGNVAWGQQPPPAQPAAQPAPSAGPAWLNG